MRILFVQPAWSDIHGPFTGMAKSQASVPPLGVGYLAALARQQGHEVSILDAEAECLDDDHAAQAILKRSPDIVGFTATTPLYHKAVNIAQTVKSAAPDILTMIGGPHITILGEKAFFPCFDIAVRGEAETIFPELLDAVEKNPERLSTISGVMSRKNGETIDTGWVPPIQDLDCLPFPAWDLYNRDAYTIHVKGKGFVPYATMNLTRGCPFKCAFCSAALLEGKKLRCRSAQNAVDEIIFLRDHFDIRHICFNDSTLTLKESLIEEFSNRMIDLQVGVTWEGWTRANLVDEDLLALMKRAGFVRISFGIESGSPHVLKLIHKEVSHEDMRRAYRIAGKLDIEATCSAMMGHPGETEADVWETVRLIRSIPEIEYSPLSIAVPYPGTELYEMAKNEQHGLKLVTEDYSKYLRYAGGVMEVNGMTPEYLTKLQKRALIWMHLTPGKIIGTIRRFGLKPILQSIFG